MKSIGSVARNDLFALFAAMLFVFLLHPAQGATLEVSGFANVFGAGKTIPPSPGSNGGGILPPSFAFDPAPNQIVMFTSVSGSIQGAPGDFAPPDGVSHLVNAASYDGIAGVLSPVAVPLAGVFLGPNEPLDPAPQRLDFQSSGIGTAFEEISPQISQVFFIGDGLTGTGSGTRQVFRVPPTATRLFLGLFDGYHLGDNVPKLPGYYEDNGGAFTATFTLIPIPALTINNLGSELELSWPTEADLFYQLEWSDLKVGSSWSPLGAAVAGTDSEATVGVPAESPDLRFYRLVVRP